MTVKGDMRPMCRGVVKEIQVQHESGIVNKNIVSVYSYRNNIAMWQTVAKYNSKKSYMRKDHLKKFVYSL
jgi:hypothetical protein